MILTGIALKLAGHPFDPTVPHTCCRLCGGVFQSKLAGLEATLERRAWSFKHARTHTPLEHRRLALSGNWCTPEAAQKLAAFGIIDLVGLVMDDEIEQAYKEAPREMEDLCTMK